MVQDGDCAVMESHGEYNTGNYVINYDYSVLLCPLHLIANSNQCSSS